MSASPRRCRSGPQKRIGMRDAPACASISSKCADTAPDGIEDQRPGLVAVLDAYAVDLEERPHDLHVADVGDIPQHARRVAQQRRHHRLRGEVLRALDLDATGQRPAAADREGLSGHFLLLCLGVGRNAEKRLHPVVLTCVVRGVAGRITRPSWGDDPGLRDRERPRPPCLAASLELRDPIRIAQREPDVIEPLEKPPPSVIIDVERHREASPSRSRVAPRDRRSSGCRARPRWPPTAARCRPPRRHPRRGPACPRSRGRCRRIEG